MNKIGFQNFRRFQNFTPIEYKGVTFLVGRNNAGKSTLVKAMLLINDYFKSGNIARFSFGNNMIENTNIVTYGRAKNRKAQADDFIGFYIQDGQYSIQLTISGDDDSTVADVYEILIADSEIDVTFLIKPANNSITISKGKVKSYFIVEDSLDNILHEPVFSEREFDEIQKTIELKNNLMKEETLLKKEIAAISLKKATKAYINLINDLDSIRKKKELLTVNLDDIPKEGKVSYTYTTEYGNRKDLLEIVEYGINAAIIEHNQEFPQIQEGRKESINFKNYRAIKEDDGKLQNSISTFYLAIVQLPKIFYLGSNAVKQAALFQIRDRGNTLTQAIHDYYQLKISPGEKANLFVLKWMKAFEVGEDFEIILHAGEAYELKVKSNDTTIHLADKGMGSIQAMLLILRLATIIHSCLNTDDIVTIIIEEPELNLHPALQSKLADLIFEVYEEFHHWFLIETHSEYIIRRTQVLVAEKELVVAPNTNPFCAYYFPKEIESIPYQLSYQADGTFDKNFGDGFFDEASSSTLELLKLKRQKKA